MQAVRLMLQYRISGLPVVGARGELVGVVTEGDFLRRGGGGPPRPRSPRVGVLICPRRPSPRNVYAPRRQGEEVMTRSPVAIAEDTPLDEAVELMERHRIKRLPVVRNNRPVGIVSRSNIMRALIARARDAKAPALDDAAIRERILAECEKQSW